MLERNQTAGAKDQGLAGQMAAIFDALEQIQERLDAVESRNAGGEADDAEIDIEQIAELTDEEITEAVQAGDITAEEGDNLRDIRDSLQAAEESPEHEMAGIPGGMGGGIQNAAKIKEARTGALRNIAGTMNKEADDIFAKSGKAGLSGGDSMLSAQRRNRQGMKSFEAREARIIELETMNEALRHALRSGNRPLAHSAGNEGGSRLHEFDAAVAGKAATGLTQAAAIQQAARENPEAYLEYLAQRGLVKP